MTAVASGTVGAVGDLELERQVRALQRRYVAAVDDMRLDDWVGLFAPECSYLVISRENVDRGLPLALVHDDSAERVRDRVVYVEKVWKGHINDYRQRHILSDPDLVWDHGTARVRTGFAVYLSEAHVPGSRLLTTGEYVDTVVLVGDEPRFAEKRVVLDSDVLPRYFVYPL